MTADIAPLGFSVDTSSLKEAQAEAKKTTAEFNKMADSAGKAAETAGRKAEALRKAADEAKKASEGSSLAAQQEAAALEKAAAKAETVAKAKRAEADALKQSAQAANENAAALAKVATGGSSAGAGLTVVAEHANRASSSISASVASVTNLAAAMARGGSASLAGAAQGVTTAFAGMLPFLGALGMAAGSVTLVATATGFAFYKVSEFFAPFQDRLAAVDARLRNTIQTSATTARRIRDDITSMSQDTGLGFAPSADAFLRMARNRGSIGANTSELLALTEATQKLGVISGAGAGETASGMLQLSQALASGRLQGDELRSIMEQMPALAKAIADGLGVSVGQLRNMGSEGQLTSDKVFAAILSQIEKIRSEFAAMPDTVERANQRLSDSFDRLFANIGKSIDASPKMQALTNLMNSGVSAAATYFDTDPMVQSKVRSDGIVAALSEAQKQLAEARSSANSGSSWWEGRGAQWYKEDSVRNLQARVDALQKQLLAEQYRMYQPMTAPEATIRSDAAVERGMVVTQDVLRLASAQKEAQTRATTLEEAIAALQSGLTKLTPEEAATKLRTLQDALAAVRAQAEENVSALDKFRRATSELDRLRTTYGADNIDAAKQASQLAIDSTKAGAPTSEAEAMAAITADKIASAKVSIEREKNEILRLRDQTAAAARGLVDLNVELARQKQALELGPAANTTSGRKLVDLAGEEARARAQAERDLLNAKSEMAPEPRATGDVRRQMEQLQRSIDDLNAMRGASSARQAAIQFEAGLAEDLKTIPDSMKAAYEQLKRAQFGAQQANAAEAPFTNAEQSVDEMQRQLEMQSAAFGKSRADAASLNEQLRLYNDLVRQGVEVTPEMAARIKAMGDAYGTVQGKLDDLSDRQQRAIADMDQFRGATRSALGSLVSGDFKGALTGMLDFAKDKVLDNINESLFSKNGALGGGAFGDFFGGIFGAANGVEIGRTAANPMWVQIAGAALGSAVGDNKPADAILPSVKSTVSSAGAGTPASVDATVATAIEAAGGGKLTIPSRVNTAFDPRLMEILKTTSERYGYNAELISGLRPGDPRLHGKGMAADIQLFDRSGKAIPNYQSATGFRDYEVFAQRARLTQQELYPQLNDDFRWGGYFSGPKGKYGSLDTMHFDLGGHQMAGGAWATGLTTQQRNFFPGAQSFGMDALGQINTSASSAANALEQLGNTSATASQGVETLGTKAQDASSTPTASAPTTQTIGASDQNAFGIGDLLSSLTSGLSGIFGQFGSIFSSIFSSLFKGIGGGGGGFLSSILGFLFNADGNVFQSPSLHRYANSVVDRPSFFAFAAGGGIMGEAGPEAIMPLKRGSDGKLGVSAMPSFAPANANQSGGAVYQTTYAPQVTNVVQSTGNRQTDEHLAKRMNEETKTALDNHLVDFMHRESRNGGMLKSGKFT